MTNGFTKKTRKTPKKEIELAEKYKKDYENRQKNVLEKAKVKYEAEKDDLAELIKLRNEMRKEEIMEAVIKSNHSYAEILAYIRGESEEGDE